MIHSIDPLDLYNGVNCNSLSFVNDITNSESLASANSSAGESCLRLLSLKLFLIHLVEKRSTARNASAEAAVNEFQTPEYVLPNIKEVPIMPLHLNGIKTKVT